MDYTKEQLEKLPKWAKSEIKRLQGLTQTLNQRLSEFNGKAETNTYLVEGLNKMPLMNNAQIEFATGKNQLNKVTVYVRSNGLIDINSDSRLGEELVILPRAANSFYLSFINR
jgi:hypothetical protein